MRRGDPAALALASVLTAAACGAFTHSHGGTPGPPAIVCPAGDAACETVLAGLETVRGNIGGFCGTPDMTAHERTLVFVGPAAVPWLERALADRDPEVAAHAAWLLHDLGAGARVGAFCAARGGTAPLCASQDHLREQGRLGALGGGRFTGVWQPTPGAADEPVSARFVVAPDGAVTGEWCALAAGACTPLAGRVTGRRLAFIVGALELVFDTGWADPRHGVVCDGACTPAAYGATPGPRRAWLQRWAPP